MKVEEIEGIGPAHAATLRATTRRAPTETMVADWIAQAKKLPKVVTH